MGDVYAYWLSNSGASNRAITRLLDHVSSAEDLFFLPEQQIRAIPFVDAVMCDRVIESRAHMGERQEEFEKLSERGIWFVSREDAAYPDRLKKIADAPFSFYIKGRLPDEKKRAVAIVGARNCSEYGYAMAKEIGRSLANCGAVVISGMARGVDASGHKGALQADGETVAVLGGGVDVVYPYENRKLYQEILEKNGAILSEQPPGTKPMPHYFPIRNRVISGLSDVVVVVEARERSGSLITADYALEQGKDIYAVPGRVTDATSGGCNNLIHQGAGIITDVGQFVKELSLLPETKEEQLSFENLLLEKEELLVYSCVDLRPKSIEELLQKTGLSVPAMLQILAVLEQKGFITETFKNYYIRRF